MKTKLIIPLAVFCLLFGVPVQAADDYLSTLEEYADDLDSNQVSSSSTAGSAVPARKKATVVDKEQIRAGLSFDEFEEELETSYSGSYFLYAKLKSRQRKAVYSFYQKDSKVEPIRQEIVRQLSNGS